MLLASSSQDCTIRFWDVETGVVAGAPLVGHDGIVSSVSLAPLPSTGRLLLASGSWDRTVRVWDVDAAAGGVDGASVAVLSRPCATLRWTSRARAQPLDAQGLVLSPTAECGLQPHQLKLLQHYGMQVDSRQREPVGTS